jgi:hypothetical protein
VVFSIYHGYYKKEYNTYDGYNLLSNQNGFEENFDDDLQMFIKQSFLPKQNHNP